MPLAEVVRVGGLCWLPGGIGGVLCRGGLLRSLRGKRAALADLLREEAAGPPGGLRGARMDELRCTACSLTTVSDSESSSWHVKARTS